MEDQGAILFSHRNFMLDKILQEEKYAFTTSIAVFSVTFILYQSKMVNLFDLVSLVFFLMVCICAYAFSRHGLLIHDLEQIEAKISSSSPFSLSKGDPNAYWFMSKKCKAEKHLKDFLRALLALYLLFAFIYFLAFVYDFLISERITYV